MELGIERVDSEILVEMNCAEESSNLLQDFALDIQFVKIAIFLPEFRSEEVFEVRFTYLIAYFFGITMSNYKTTIIQPFYSTKNASLLELYLKQIV